MIDVKLRAEGKTALSSKTALSASKVRTALSLLTKTALSVLRVKTALSLLTKTAQKRQL